eukprot:Phypoly_transcript_07407.p1 GENE.Phypoly_transcript_07407~~Phypoly_transcript_07407.p1  ORF type:complete len:518 (-),score=105.85 Phypoly_transcript_07407:7-1560(-)
MLRLARSTQVVFHIPSPFLLPRLARRRYATETKEYDGVVIGIHEDGGLTQNGKALDDLSKGLIKKQWDLTKKKGKPGDSVLLLESITSIPRIAVVGLGKHDNEMAVSNMRKGAGLGATLLRDNGATNVGIDTSFGNLQATAEGTFLALYKYDKGTPTSKEKATPKIDVGPFPLNEQTDNATWKKGEIVAQAQNMSKQLADTPSNLMTPKIFIAKVEEMFANLPNKDKFRVIVRDENWIQEKKMGLLYGVGKGSAEPPRLLEIHYRNSPEPNQLPLIYVGKGVCFDSGGYSIKPSQAMEKMKGDMLGAASVVCALNAIIQLGLETNVSVVVPLVENMLSSRAVKPGDVLTGMNGKTVEITNTDAEGRLILADALSYAQQFKPHTLIDVATLTGAIATALGFGIGAFTPENDLYNEIEAAASKTNEKFWRMPLYGAFKKQLESHVADLVNSTGKPGGASSAAMFLKEFVHLNRWMHLDIAAVMTEGTGMSGKPVRTLVQLAENYTTKPPVNVIYYPTKQ